MSRAGIQGRRDALPDKRRPVIIDDIRKRPALLDEVQSLISRRGMRFILAGSVFEGAAAPAPHP